MLARHVKTFKKINSNILWNHIQTQTHPQIQTAEGNVIPVFRKAVNFPEKIALRDSAGSYTYANIFLSAKELANDISQKLDCKTNERVLFMCPNDANYLITLWAIWMSGQIAVPLSPLHPQNFLLYYTNDSKAKLIITSPKYKDITERIVKNAHTQLYVLDDKMKLECPTRVHKHLGDLEAGMPHTFYNTSNAMILYTSGTTGNPKGALLSHKNLYSQANMLLNSWKWTSNDVILHTLPLHHVHGIVNALLCPLYVGAKTIMLPKFDANSVWSYLLAVSSKPDDRKINVYMAVPTIYSKLIQEYERVFSKDPKMVEYIKNTLKNRVRLMVSGSAPLPNPVFNKWFEISGHQLLERYGMTETGMCLSNLYDGQREPGYVGVPLPGVSVRIAEKDSKNNYPILVECSNIDGKIDVKVDEKLVKTSTPTGHLLVKSDGVFKEYFERPEATIKDFAPEEYFNTGDICRYEIENKRFKILGRENIDIIKTGGYKVSAIEIETHLLSNVDIKECAVVGLPDEMWGQKIAAIVVLTDDNKFMTVEELKSWALNKLPKYSIPTILKVVQEIPRNAMGKVNKRDLLKNVFADVK